MSTAASASLGEDDWVQPVKDTSAVRRRLLEEFSSSDTFSPAATSSLQTLPADDPAEQLGGHQSSPSYKPEGSYLATQTEDAGILASLVSIHSGTSEHVAESPVVLPSDVSAEQDAPSTPPHKKPSESAGPVTPQTNSVKQTPPQTPSSALNSLLQQLGEKVVLTPSRIPKPKGGTQRLEKY